jgi:hypothetical protein
MFRNIENFNAIKETIDNAEVIDSLVLTKLRTLKLKNLGDISVQLKAVKCKVSLMTELI